MSRRLTQNPAPTREKLDQLLALAKECDPHAKVICSDAVLEQEAGSGARHDRDAERDFNAVTAERICREAAGLVAGKRAEQHGDWLDLHTHAAAMFSAFLGVPVNPAQAAKLEIIYKLCRSEHGVYNPDDYRDIAGYGGGAGEIAARLNRGEGGGE